MCCWFDLTDCLSSAQLSSARRGQVSCGERLRLSYSNVLRFCCASKKEKTSSFIWFLLTKESTSLLCKWRARGSSISIVLSFSFFSPQSKIKDQLLQLNKFDSPFHLFSFQTNSIEIESPFHFGILSKVVYFFYSFYGTMMMMMMKPLVAWQCRINLHHYAQYVPRYNPPLSLCLSPGLD